MLMIAMSTYLPPCNCILWTIILAPSVASSALFDDAIIWACVAIVYTQCPAVDLFFFLSYSNSKSIVSC